MLLKSEIREKKTFKERYGMKVSGRSVFDILRIKLSRLTK